MTVSVKVAPIELYGRQIDGNARRQQAARHPDPVVRQRAAERPLSDLEDQPGLLQQRYEVSRRHEAGSGLLPPQQRLHPADRPGREQHLGLVVQHELLLFHRFAQAGFQRQRLRGARVHLGRVEQVALARLPRVLAARPRRS
jgi:hypothetical protein